ncbi:MAG: hypothetical protein Tsb002_13120 [Wenzhouxiangellaceae bacterium]
MTETSVVAASETAKSSIVILSESLGDAGYEMMLSGADRLSASELGQRTDVMLVYADIDSLDATEKTFAIIDQALAINLPVILESRDWNAQKLHAFVRKYDSNISLKDLENVALELIRGDDGIVRAADTNPSEVAMTVGVPYEDTAEAQAYAQLHAPTLAPIHPAAPYASAAYMPLAPAIGPYTVIRDRDVYKIWFAQGSGAGQNHCVIGLRGTNSIGDWLRDGQSQFFSSRAPYSGYTGNARIGAGWRQRSDNIFFEINQVLQQWDCEFIAVTGHSLGGAMTAVIAFNLAKFGHIIVETVGFNAARVGNVAFRDELYQILHDDPELFCRRGDPVWSLPLGYHHFTRGTDGCTFWGPRVSTINPIANHSMDLWL